MPSHVRNYFSRSNDQSKVTCDLCSKKVFEYKGTTSNSCNLLSHLSSKHPTSTKGTQIPLYVKWKATLPEVDHGWVSTTLFMSDNRGVPHIDFRRISKLWWYPPQPQIRILAKPRLGQYFGRPLFLWMPHRLWEIPLTCPHPDCVNQKLTSAGVYQKVRQVVGISGMYSLASECLECRKCKRKVVSWSHNILSQLDIGHRSQFPCILTTMKACDMKVVRLLRQRGLGNSASQIQKKIQEQHSEDWLTKSIQYLSNCEHLRKAASSGLVTRQEFQDPPSMVPVPLYRGFMQVYIQDVLQRLDEIKASITSTFGRVLKIDSTKKIVKKLSGPAAGTAQWATNLGNEHGQVLMSVLTAGEGHCLNQMVMQRYSDTKEAHPEILYVDRDCCGSSQVRRIFMHGRRHTFVWTFGTSCVVSLLDVQPTPTLCMLPLCPASARASSCGTVKTFKPRNKQSGQS